MKRTVSLLLVLLMLISLSPAGILISFRLAQ